MFATARSHLLLLSFFYLGVPACTPAENSPDSAVIEPDATTSEDAGNTEFAESFRIAFIADPHVIGPQYVCCSESDGVDNASIVRTAERLVATRDTINALDPAPDMVFVLGDVMHDAHHETDPAWYAENQTAFSITQEIMAGFNVPVEYVFGNHDYEVNCDPSQQSFDKELTHALFQSFFNAEPYHSVTHRGWRFLATNGQLGPTWDPTNPDACDVDTASYGRTQLAWIANELDQGQPTVVLSHYMRLVTATNEDPDGPHADLFELLDSRDNVAAVLVGHTHRWLDLTALNRGVPHHVLASTRYDSDNFWLIDFEVGGERFNIVDFDKRRSGSTCADTWNYDGMPMSLPDAPETGDCVTGTGN